MAHVSPALIDMGFLCLLDFANSFSSPEGPPLYLIYTPKLSVVDGDASVGRLGGFKGRFRDVTYPFGAYWLYRTWSF